MNLGLFVGFCKSHFGSRQAPDVFATVSISSEKEGGQRTTLGRTEVLQSYNPRWEKYFLIKFELGIPQFAVVTIVQKTENGRKQLLCRTTFDVHALMFLRGSWLRNRLLPDCEIVAKLGKAPDAEIPTALNKKKDSLFLKICLEGSISDQDTRNLNLQLQFFRSSEEGKGRSWINVWCSSQKVDTLNPVWDEISISYDKLCSCDGDKPIAIKVYHKDIRKSVNIGSFRTTVNKLIGSVEDGEKQKGFILTRERTRRGNIFVSKACIESKMGSQREAGMHKIASSSSKLEEKPNSRTSIEDKITTGTENIETEENNHEKLEITLSADLSDLGNSEINPFFEFCAEDRISVFKSHHIRNSVSPEWKQATINLDTLCGVNLLMPIFILIYDFIENGHHRLIGSVRTTVTSLLTAVAAERSFGLTNDGKASGSLKVVKAKITSDVNTEELLPRHGFIDYITGGCRLHMYIAIDLTETFGDASLLIDYENTIKGVVEVISKFDTDGMYPVWGFGAKFGGKVQNCFDIGDGEVNGVEGVLKCFQNVQGWGTEKAEEADLSEVVEKSAISAVGALETALEKKDQCYSILIILTHGSLVSQDKLQRAINNASSAPLSIVIIGVGDKDFSVHQGLDDFADRDPSVRDISQFVECRKHKRKSSLTKAIFNEVPFQMEEYFHRNKIQPMPPLSEETFRDGYFTADSIYDPANEEHNPFNITNYICCKRNDIRYAE